MSVPSTADSFDMALHSKKGSNPSATDAGGFLVVNGTERGEKKRSSSLETRNPSPAVVSKSLQPFERLPLFRREAWVSPPPSNGQQNNPTAVRTENKVREVGNLTFTKTISSSSLLPKVHGLT